MHIDRLELIQLRLLEALRETASITRAADIVGLTQPAASHSLSRLRASLADPLFVRTSTGMRPTPYGEKVCAAVKEALGALRSGLEASREFDPASAKRTFKIVMSDVGQLVFLPRLLAHLRANAPGIRVHAVRISPMDHGTNLESGDVDLAIGHIKHMQAGFHQRVLFHERYVCVVSAESRRFKGGLTLAAYREAQHAIADASGMAHWVLDEELARHRIAREAGLIVPEFMTLPFVIPGSDLVVTMPSRLAAQFATLVPLRVLEPPIAFPPFEIRLFWHERVHHDAASRWMRQTLVDLFQEEARRPLSRSGRKA